jgi:hypothetical protein
LHQQYRIVGQSGKEGRFQDVEREAHGKSYTSGESSSPEAVSPEFLLEW